MRRKREAGAATTLPLIGKKKRVIWNYVNESKKEEMEKRGLREGVG